MEPSAGTPENLWPLLVYAAAVIGIVAAMLGLSWVLGQRSTMAPKKGPFESGIEPIGHARFRVSAHFYLVAVFFVIFDLEAVFIFAWAIAFREAGWAGYIEIVIFITILAAALVYLWRLGTLDWAPKPEPRVQPGPQASSRSEAP